MAMRHWLASRPACLPYPVCPQSGCPVYCWTSALGAYYRVTLLSVFTGYEHPSALSASWRLSPTGLFMVPHLRTYRISCKEERARVSSSSWAPLAVRFRADRLPSCRSSLRLYERHSNTLSRQWATAGRWHRVMQTSAICIVTVAACSTVVAQDYRRSCLPRCPYLTSRQSLGACKRALKTELFFRSSNETPWSPPLIDFQSSRRPPVAMCYCRRSVVCYCRPSTMEQSTCWRLVCLVTHNILPEAENSFILAILPRHCVITTSP